jgi:hypothetical protein
LQRKLLIPVVAAGVAAAAVGAGLASSGGQAFTSVPSPALKAAGYAPSSILSPELRQQIAAEGSVKLENPQGIVTHYGYENDLPSADDASVPQMTATPASAAEAQKTEPDKNTYLVLKGQTGADPNYDYGTHFLFQGHEVGAKINGSSTNRQAYITRINLDADDAHRVTLMATQDSTGAAIQGIDGSTWDPFAKRLLLTTENTGAPTYAATLAVPSVVTDVSGALGRGGYEGIQDDSDGNIWIVEDIGGANKPGTVAKQPNSYVYRYVPAHRGDLANGKLQVLQVLNGGGSPITVESQAALDAPDQVALHAYGQTFGTKWVTIHDTATDGTAPFIAGPLAKAAHATPFKRPENGVFRPGTKFREFYFTETGDTSATSVENSGPVAGGWGGIFKLVQADPSASTGKLSVFFQGNKAHTGLDNIQFVSKNELLAVEDAGDTLHTQRNALDSGYEFDVTSDYSGGADPMRFIAEGRDFAATLDSAFGGYGKNEGDNELTGIHVSNGDPTADGILGAASPRYGEDSAWRMFYTQQHGENRTWEVTPASRSAASGDEQGDD